VSTPRTHRITPTPIPDGADLHLEGFVRHLLADVLTLLADNPGLFDQLDDVLHTDRPAVDRYQPDTGSRDDALIDSLVAALPAASLAVRLHGADLARLAGSLGGIVRAQRDPAVVGLLRQREAGAA
jgi:hypothetical protein